MRIVVAMMGVVALAVGVASSALANPPERFPAPGVPVSFPAGQVCKFAMSTEVLVDNTVVTVHFDRNGLVRWMHGAGKIVLRVRNDDTGMSADVNITGPGKLTFPDENTLVGEGTGHWLFFLFTGDSPANKALLATGNIRFTQELTTGKLTLLSSTGAPEDLCERLG